MRAICLVISKAKQAGPFLRFEDDGPVLKPLEFAGKLLTGLEAAMNADLELDRVVKVQILALMHLHNDGLGGMDRASNLLAQAIHEAWALSLHWQIPGNTDRQQCDYIWWTLRNLDRLNKPVQGAAPFIIDDSDIAIARIAAQTTNYRSQVMNMSLNLGDLMIKATRVYKASSVATEDDCHQFPSLAELVSDTSFADFHNTHQGKCHTSESNPGTNNCQCIWKSGIMSLLCYLADSVAQDPSTTTGD